MSKTPGKKTVRAWVQLSHMYIEEDLDVPEDCFDEEGNLIDSDVAEFVEKWITDVLKMEYGASIPVEDPEDHPTE